jgi:SAM-dependent methyltransferase
MGGRNGVEELETRRILVEYERRKAAGLPERYSLKLRVNQFFRCHSMCAFIRALNREGLFPPEDLRVADVGCGRGIWLSTLSQWGAQPENLAGIDLRAEDLEHARKLLPRADLRLGNAGSLPWADGTFDLVSQFTVFTSILDGALRKQVASEMLRVLKPDGVILWFDFRFDNPANSSVKGQSSKALATLFPGCCIKRKLVMLAPPIARATVPVSWILAELLNAVPFLRSHYVATIRRRASAAHQT